MSIALTTIFCMKHVLKGGNVHIYIYTAAKPQTRETEGISTHKSKQLATYSHTSGFSHAVLFSYLLNFLLLSSKYHLV